MVNSTESRDRKVSCCGTVGAAYARCADATADARRRSSKATRFSRVAASTTMTSLPVRVERRRADDGVLDATPERVGAGVVGGGPLRADGEREE
jgi:hypothetical protein